jgi:predicted XRE-type DNA-binding protein
MQSSKPALSPYRNGRKPRQRALTGVLKVGDAPGNLLLRRDLRNSGKLSPKATLALKVNRLIDLHRLNQSVAAQRLGMSQPRISAIRNLNLRGISLERLMQALVALDQKVEIVVRPGGKSARGSITVAT